METIYYQMSSEGEKNGLEKSISGWFDKHFEVVDYGWPESYAATLGLMWGLIIGVNIIISIFGPR